MPDPTETFADILCRLSVLFVQVRAERAALHDTFTKQDLLTIGFLGTHGPSRMSQIADHLGLVRGAVTPIVDRLEETGVAERRRSQTDRRAWLVELTDEGQEIFASEIEAYRQVAREMLSALPSDDQAVLIDLMETIRETVFS